MFLTDSFELSALAVAYLYKQRWQAAPFSKWTKQHLKVRPFWGHSEHAVRTQVYRAVIAYCLVAILGRELKTERSTYEILQILDMSSLDNSPLNGPLAKVDHKNIKELKALV